VHYSEGQWIDYVRGLADQALATEMQAHLHLNCTACQALVASLSMVEATSSRDRALSVPSEVISRAMAIFRPEPRPSFLDLPRRVAELLFDSSQQPLLAGARSADQQVRHMVFQSRVFRADLQVELLSPKRMMVLTGQLSTQTSEAVIAEGVRVALTDGNLTLAEAQANEFGEFELECRFQMGLQLVAWSPQGPEAVVMDLDATSAIRKT
jgi:hypothetical protein